jgi:hypothetical protein
MVFAEALSEYLIDGLSEALAQADEPTPPVPLVADRYVALSACRTVRGRNGTGANLSLHDPLPGCWVASKSHLDRVGRTISTPGQTSKTHGAAMWRVSPPQKPPQPPQVPRL